MGRPGIERALLPCGFPIRCWMSLRSVPRPLASKDGSRRRSKSSFCSSEFMTTIISLPGLRLPFLPIMRMRKERWREVRGERGLRAAAARLRHPRMCHAVVTLMDLPGNSVGERRGCKNPEWEADCPLAVIETKRQLLVAE